MTGDPSRMPEFEAFDWDADEFDEADVFGPGDQEETQHSGDIPAPAVQDEDGLDAEAVASAPLHPSSEMTAPLARDGGWASPSQQRRRWWSLDPAFAYLVLLAMSVGLTPVAETHPVGRYGVLWIMLALAVVASRVLDDGTLEVVLKPVHLAWGAGWGVIVGLPLLLVGTRLLAETSDRMFVDMPDGAVLMTIIFVMTTTESAFFRGLIQARYPVIITAAMASMWSIGMFFPTMDVIGYPAIALIAGTFIVLLNLLYSYVQQRSGAAAAWVTQTLVSLAWLYLPRLLV